MTLKKSSVLKVDVGHGTVIRDVQLWRNFEDNEPDPTLEFKECEVIGMIDMRKLPLWIDHGERHRCYTTSQTAFNYFKAKLMRQRHRNRGILCKSKGNSGIKKFKVFYRKLQTDSGASFQIESSSLSLETKYLFDEQLKLRSNSSFMATLPTRHSIDLILEKSKQKRIQKNSSLNKKVEQSDYKRNFNSMLSQCILSGLRLRNVPQTQCEKLYKMTFQASEFTFRNELKCVEPVSFVGIQDCVETLLKLFTRT